MLITSPKALPVKNLKRLATYLDPQIFESLEQLAKDDKRTLSQMAAILIDEAIQSRKAKAQKEKE